MTILVWVGFIVLVLSLLFLDLGVFHRKQHTIGVREALGWTAFWVTLALLFNVFVYFLYDRHLFGWTTEMSGSEAAVQFLTGYLVEESLSVDNIFVIVMIFHFFRIPSHLQHRVLFWGIMGAIILRGVMIGLGAALIHNFHWIVYVFGGLLILSSIKMARMTDEEVHPDHNLAVRIARRLFPVSNSLEGSRFFTRIDGKLAITPMFLTLILVETTDVMFAIDSIPAIFAITQDPFLVFTSNIFAILGLRSLFFAVSGLIDVFRYLKASLVVLLAYIGVKMILSHPDFPLHYKIPNLVSLTIIAGILAVGVIASLIADRVSHLDEEPQPEPGPEGGQEA
jgi:tellurite resistance protein TerC